RGADMDITERKRAEGEIRSLLEQSDKDRDALLGILEDVKRGQEALRRSEEALRQANQMLRLHFEQTPMAVIEWDLDFRVTQWNPAARTIFGFSREEAVGQHASFILPEAVRPQVDQVWQALLKRSGGARSTNQNMRKDGRAILCEWYNTPLVDERGKVAGVASLVQDVTERKRAEQALRKSEASMADAQARAHVGSWELDLTTQEATWSHEMYRLYGRDPSRGVPMFEEFLDLVHTEDRPALIEARRRALETGELVHTDFRTNPEQAPARYIQGRLQGVRDPSGRITGLVGTEADLTERKQAEETMRRQLEELRRWQAVILGREDRVLELKKEVNELARKLGEKPRYEGGIKAE
ncbi:MAG: PAS domain S-box protein, partial [Verrucomicrobia bacterium]|nr:PAS domain S-box protein [Verrucomicrobiota bacterium]